MFRLTAIGASFAALLLLSGPAPAQTSVSFGTAEARAAQFSRSEIAAFQNDLAWVDAFADLAVLPSPGTFDDATFQAIRLYERRSKKRESGTITPALIKELRTSADSSRDAQGFREIRERGLVLGYPAKLLTAREDRTSGPRLRSPKGDVVLDILAIPASQESFADLYQRLKKPQADGAIDYAALRDGTNGEPAQFVITGTRGQFTFYMRFLQDGGASRGFAVSWDANAGNFYAPATAMALSLKLDDGASPAATVSTAGTKPLSGKATVKLNQDLDTCAQAKDGDEIIAACTAALSVGEALLPGNRPVVLFNRAVGYDRKGQFDLAIADLDKAIELAPDKASYFNQRGHMYYYKGQYDRAVADYSQALGKEAPTKAAYSNRGNAYFFLGDNAKAVADYDAALRLAPDDAVIRAYRGSALLRLGRAGEALADLTFAIERGGEGVIAGDYTNRGVALIELGRADEAAADFARAETLTSAKIEADGGKDVNNLLYRAFARALGNRDLDGAIADATGYLAAKPAAGEGFHARALAYAAKKDTADALADFAKAISLGRKGFILRQRGDLYLAAGQPELAIADYQAQLAQMPGNTLATAGLEKARQALAAKQLTAAGTPQGGNAQQGASTAALSQPPKAELGRRVALVIGNSAYANVPALPNPKNDAAKVAATLREIGFAEVTLVEDANNQALNAALQAFAGRADGADWAVIYYAGHGIEVANTNYLVPVDAKLASDRDVTFEAVPLDRVLAASEGAKGMRLVILDACRNNPFLANMTRRIATRAVSRGLSRVEPDGGTLVVYAAKAGEVALDGESGNSPFVTALTSNLEKPNIEIGKLFRLVRDDVMKATGRKQEPFTYGSLPGEDFIFNPH